jgi:hypothetical protein
MLCLHSRFQGVFAKDITGCSAGPPCPAVAGFHAPSRPGTSSTTPVPSPHRVCKHDPTPAGCRFKSPKANIIQSPNLLRRYQRPHINILPIHHAYASCRLRRTSQICLPLCYAAMNIRQGNLETKTNGRSRCPRTSLIASRDTPF